MAGLLLLKLLPKFGRDASMAQVYWRGVEYFLIGLVLMAVIDIIGGF
jgi:hypothetical protein